MIDFEKQPHCATCPFCVGFGSDHYCAEWLDYKEDGSCVYESEKLAECRWDALVEEHERKYEDE